MQNLAGFRWLLKGLFLEKLSFFSSLLATGFTVAFFHAALPTHWLPFVLAARAHKWDLSKTLSVVTLAGLGHVVFTSLLGVLIVWFGIALSDRYIHFFPTIAGFLLCLVGLSYFVRSFRGHSHRHFFFLKNFSESQLPYKGPNGGQLIDTGREVVEVLPSQSSYRLLFFDHTLSPIQIKNAADYQVIQNSAETFLQVKHQDHFHNYQISQKLSSSPSILGLLVILTLSPCEAFLPVYLSALQFSWYGFILLTAILGVGTLGGMYLFTTLTLKGFTKIGTEFFEKYESTIMGSLLVALGLALIFWRH